MPDELSSQLASLRINRDAPAQTRRGSGGLWRWLVGLGVLGGLGVAFYVFAVPRLEGEIFKTAVSYTEVLSVSPAEASVQLTSAGYVVPQRVSHVAPKMPGKVAEVFVTQGQKVEPGQVMITLDPTDDNATIMAAKSRVLAVQARAASARATVLTLQAELAEGKQQHAREVRLSKEGVSATGISDDLAARVNSLEHRVAAAQAEAAAATAEARAQSAELEAMTTRLDNLTIRAPIAGVLITKPPQLGEVVSAGADAPSVDVNVGNDGGAPELPGVARFADSGPDGVPLPSGAALQIGIESGGEVVTAFTTPELPEGAQLFVVATGLLAALPRESTGFGLLAVGPDGVIGLIPQNPVVYALHASPDAGEVDICVADTPLVVGAEYFDLARVQVPPGAYDLEFHAAPSDCTGAPVSTQSTGDLAAGQQYLAIATGEVSPEAGDDNQAFQLAAYVEQFDLDAAPEATFRVIHSAIAPTVDVGTLDGNGQLTDDTLLVTDLSWPDESDAVTVPAGNYEVGVIGASTMLPDPPIAAYMAPLGEGTRAWAIAVGDLQSNGGEPGFSVWALLTDTQPWTLVELPEA